MKLTAKCISGFIRWALKAVFRFMQDPGDMFEPY